MRHWWRAIFIQAGAWLLAGAFMDGLAVALCAAGAAATLSILLKEPIWRAPLQGLFALGLYWGSADQGPPAGVWLGLLLVSVPLFGAGIVGARRAPLYLTHKKALEALLLAIPDSEKGPCLDVGAGLGSFIRQLAAHRPNLHISGVENAPLTCFIGDLLCRLKGAGRIFWGDLWRTELKTYQVVYAFLSPEAMPDLWQKAKKEMHPGSLLIVHAFPVPGVEPEASFAYGLGASERIYRYRI